MARKRMFRLDVLETDAFMEMPLTTQALYFHLNLRADDDGFIGNPNQIVRLVGASMDDLKLLIAKRFVLVFEDGVIVIKHWRMHNTLSANRYKETNFTEDKALLRLKENKAYTFNDNGMAICDTHLKEISKRQTKDEQKTNSEENRIEENRIEEDSKGEDRLEESKPPISPKQKPVYYPNDEKLNQAFVDYVAMRKQIKKPMSDRAIELAISKLEKLSKGDNDMAIAILEQSILGSWQGLYELKPEFKGHGTSAFDVFDAWEKA